MSKKEPIKSRKNSISSLDSPELPENFADRMVELEMRIDEPNIQIQDVNK
jgi:hypothetical protein